MTYSEYKRARQWSLENLGEISKPAIYAISETVEFKAQLLNDAMKNCAAAFDSELSPIKCLIRSIYYWFRYPTGYPISGHEYQEQDDGSLKCKDCGRVSK